MKLPSQVGPIRFVGICVTLDVGSVPCVHKSRFLHGARVFDFVSNLRCIIQVKKGAAHEAFGGFAPSQGLSTATCAF